MKSLSSTVLCGLGFPIYFENSSCNDSVLDRVRFTFLAFPMPVMGVVSGSNMGSTSDSMSPIISLMFRSFMELAMSSGSGMPSIFVPFIGDSFLSKNPRTSP